MTQPVSQLNSSIDALSRELEIITHNLANASTAGFKRRSNAFTKILDKQQGTPETYTPGKIDLQSAFDFSQGNLVQTGRSLDFALGGRGFFTVETPNGPLYTRNGVFEVNQNGQIVDSMGRIVSGESGPITLPASVSMMDINVATDGRISANGSVIGKFKVVDFKKEDENKLAPAGGNCFMISDKSIQPTSPETVFIKQGSQESSNVKVVDELVDMVMVTRLYEANMKYVGAQRENSSTLTSVAMG
jgi:flagellar basal-body rod protein FlgF